MWGRRFRGRRAGGPRAGVCGAGFPLSAGTVVEARLRRACIARSRPRGQAQLRPVAARVLTRGPTRLLAASGRSDVPVSGGPRAAQPSAPRARGRRRVGCFAWGDRCARGAWRASAPGARDAWGGRSVAAPGRVLRRRPGRALAVQADRAACGARTGQGASDLRPGREPPARRRAGRLQRVSGQGASGAQAGRLQRGAEGMRRAGAVRGCAGGRRGSGCLSIRSARIAERSPPPDSAPCASPPRPRRRTSSP